MVSTTPVSITPSVSVGGSAPLLIIAGPCQIESKEHARSMAVALQRATAGLPVSLVYKSSFDKANRTSLKGARGIGIDEGLAILEYVKSETGLPLLTDIHDEEQAARAARSVDIIQTPAFLCRQTDLLIAAGKTNKTINVKKGQFLAPQDMAHVAEKIASTGNKNILLCERGACFGYRDLVVDMRSLLIMQETGYPVIFDATHSVQSMGGAGGASGGSREYVAPLARAAVATGVSGVFIECHDAPERAPSDGASMLRLNDFRPLVESLCRIRDAV
jgi:2-dehydro-3-deoxyphosphooctonate aldolase (KDO 8-P synthase)